MKGYLLTTEEMSNGCVVSRSHTCYLEREAARVAYEDGKKWCDAQAKGKGMGACGYSNVICAIADNACYAYHKVGNIGDEHNDPDHILVELNVIEII